MTHEWHDAYRHRVTPAHHLDPRSKLLAGLLFVGFVLFTPQLHWRQSLGYGLVILSALLLAKVPWRPFVRRASSLLPFALLMLISILFSKLSWTRMADVLFRAMLSVGAMAVLASTTPFPDLLRALYQWRLPRPLILFLAFLFRYGVVLQEEVHQVEQAWRARSFGRSWRPVSQLGPIIASLFIRSYERAERVYGAMQARGFTSASPPVVLLHFGPADLLFAFGLIALLMAIRWGAA